MTYKTKLVTLDNGAKIVARKFSGTHTAQVQWSLVGGSHYEAPHEHGVAHFVEHTVVNPDLIYKPIKSRGAVVNAYTNHDNIVMWARVLPEHMADAQQRIFEHGLMRPAIRQTDFDREFGPIKIEITERLSDPGYRLHVSAEAVMSAGQPRAHFIAGTHADMDTHTLAKLHNFLARVKAPQGVIACAAGNFDQRAFFKAAERHLRDLPVIPSQSVDPGRFSPGEAVFVEPPSREGLSLNEQSVGLLARFQGVTEASPDRAAYALLGYMLSSGMDSPLMTELREKRGLVYGVSAGNSMWSTDGYFQVDLMTSRKNIEAATEVLADTLAKASVYLTPQRFEQIRNSILFAEADSVEDSKDWSMRAVRDLRLYGYVREREEILQAVSSVTLSDVCRVSEAAFSKPAFVAALGPVEGVAFKPVFDRAMRLTAG